MSHGAAILTFFPIACLWAVPLFSQPQVLTGEVVHLRNGGHREWTTFAERADRELNLTFPAQAGVVDHTLEFTQTDVKQVWQVVLNGVNIGELIQDEKRLTSYLRVPASLLKGEGNVLTIRSDEKAPDDITVGHLYLHRGSLANLMSAVMEVSIADDGESLVPGRITIINDKRSLQTVSTNEDSWIAVRPGCIYSTRTVAIRVPAGRYTLYANRGFEYGVDSVVLAVKPGDVIKHRFVVRSEVDTKGWISSDTHVHTFTYSRHGDANLRERVLTLAGEGIEMPVMTDHNVYVDLKPSLDSVSREDANVRMTPVVGDELTTQVGHFNVFDVPKQGKVIDHRGRSWSDVASALKAVGTGKVVILNHAQDVHQGFRPFGATNHFSSAGLDVKGRIVPANAMEVINSGSQQSDFMRLFQDWFGMLNAGHRLTPIGCSDSHDVNRFIVGQGRTYIRGVDEHPDAINTAEAIRAIIRGEVVVSCGLLTRILVNNTYGPGELATGARRANVKVDVLGPAWSNADSIILYMNGVKIKQDWVSGNPGEPIFQSFSWDIDLPIQDVYFAAIAYGTIGDIPYWPIAKPYQPVSPDWTPHVYAGTGAVWVDVDGDGRGQSAAYYAASVYKRYKQDPKALIGKLDSYDEAVAIQVAALLWKDGQDLNGDNLKAILSRSQPYVRRGFATVAKEAEEIRK